MDSGKKFDIVDEGPPSTGSNSGLEAPPSSVPETGSEIMEKEESSNEPASVKDSSILEMEVEDSNTGDTITSNPEIDLGSAAAAATAVIMEDTEKLEESEGSLGVVAEITDTPDSPTEDFNNDDNPESAERSNVEIMIHTAPGGNGNVRTASDVSASSAGLILNREDSIKLLTDDEDSRTEAMDTHEKRSFSEADFNKEDTIFYEAQEHASGSGTEMDHDQDLNNEPESDSALEMDHDHVFLHEEESLASLPDDIVETDKENNGADPDLALACDDENDDGEDAYLEITRRRISQDREGNCYCGKDRNFNIGELLCASCYRWFHESCISYQLGRLVPFITNYVFTCKNCSHTGLECFRRNLAPFSQMCVTVLANLTQQSIKEGTNIKKFSKDKDIIPFFEMHWEALATTTRRMPPSWQSSVTKTLMKDAGIVYSSQEIPGDENSPYFGLVSDDLSQIRPNYEAMIRSGQLKITDQRNSSSSFRGRGAKRRTVLDPAISAPNNMNKKPRSDTYGPKPSVGHGYPTEHPFNKDSYRYILAEPDPNAPFRQEFDESNEWSGKPIHGWLCRSVNPSSVLLALHDRAPQLKVSEDRLSVTGEKGYCMIRATHGVNRGSWYFEAKITDMPEGSATRIGFCQQFGNLQGPLGFDRFGYSWRSRYGTAFHEARGKSYARGGYGLDDVLGFLIVLPDSKGVPLVPASFKDRPLVKVKSHLYYEDKDDPKELNKRESRPGSKIICFKNGVCQGEAFSDIFCGTYYPAISVYKSITVRTNFGPDFWAPPTDIEYRGMFERAEEAIVEHTMADLVYLTENDGRLRLDNAVPKPM